MIYKAIVFLPCTIVLVNHLHLYIFQTKSVLKFLTDFYAITPLQIVGIIRLPDQSINKTLLN